MSDNPELSVEQQIAAQRSEIDAIDQELVVLLNRRAQAALSIGQIKRTNGRPLYDPQRETEVIEKIIGANEGPLHNDSLRYIFGVIMRADKKAQVGETLYDDPTPVIAKRTGYGWRTGGSW